MLVPLYLVLLLAICQLVIDFADYWILLVQFCDAQVVVDHLKQYDKDGKGALSRDELQAAIRGAVCRGVICGVYSDELQTYEVLRNSLEMDRMMEGTRMTWMTRMIC